LSDEEGVALAAWMKEILGNKVGEVRVSKRLVESPALIADSNKFMTASMRKILKAAGKDVQSAAPAYDLEINPRHIILMSLQKQREKDPQLAAKVVEQILDNTRVAAGLLEDPRAMVARLNELLEKVLTNP
jgi:molecular chaperone HtpG